MKIKMTTVVLAGAALIMSTNAWSWYMEGGKDHFNAGEWGFCKEMGTDGAAIMFSRQMGGPLLYPYDDKIPPSDMQKKNRTKFIQLAETYPIESTKEKKMAVSEKFATGIQRDCLDSIRRPKPESFAE